MDQHPIPQDVTGFQFKLIGSMTVKQFGYIASGAIMAVLIFYLPKMHVIAKTILIPLFGAGGVIIAFIPIEGRPIDVMTKNFFKAVFSPNQYAYKRAGRRMSFSHIADVKAAEAKAAIEAAKKAAKEPKVKTTPKNQKEEQLRALLQNTHHTSQNNLDTKENTFLTNITAVAAPIQKSPPAPTSTMVSSGIPQSTESMTNSFLNKINPATQNAGPVPAPTATAIAQPNIMATPTPAPIQQPAFALHPVSMSQPASKIPPHIQTPSPTSPVAESMLSADQKMEDELRKKEDLLEKELIVARQEEVSEKAAPVENAVEGMKMGDAQLKVSKLERQIQDTHQEKLRLEEEIAKLKSQLSAQHTSPPPSPTLTQPKAAVAIDKPVSATRQDAEHVRSIPQAMNKSVGLPHVSDTPNVVVGIVKDPRGNVIPNILIEVKDKDDNPVRAFKTSALGQFASATALPLGTYTIVLEDPKKAHTFDTIQIVANNQIMLPIEIISHDAREELRKQLFN